MFVLQIHTEGANFNLLRGLVILFSETHPMGCRAPPAAPGPEVEQGKAPVMWGAGEPLHGPGLLPWEQAGANTN